jgi:hypothetical protein
MAVFWVVSPCSLVEVYQRFRGPCCLHHQGDEFALMMEAARTSETLVNFYQTARCCNPEDSNLHTHRRENLRSANILLSHRENLVRHIYELLLFPNSWPKNPGAAYTRANTVYSISKNKVHIILMQRDARWTWYMRGVSYAILTRNSCCVGYLLPSLEIFHSTTTEESIRLFTDVAIHEVAWYVLKQKRWRNKTAVLPSVNKYSRYY